MISLKDLRLRFRSGFYLQISDLEIRDGTLMCIIGETGSGKSTLLQLIGGHLAPDSGAVHYDGISVHELVGAKRPARTVFQDFALFPHLSVRKQVELAYGSRYKAGADESIDALLQLVEVPTDIAARLPERLSGGQKQRSAIGRALAGCPTVLLCDEPLSAQPPRPGRGLWERVLRHHRVRRQTQIVVTHNLDIARHSEAELLVLHEGKVLQRGSYEELRTAPSDPLILDLLDTSRPEIHSPAAVA